MTKAVEKANPAPGSKGLLAGPRNWLAHHGLSLGLGRQTLMRLGTSLFRRPKTGNLVQRFRSLSPNAARLKEVSGSLEKSFLATLASLQNLTSDGEKFVQDSERLVRIATGQAEERKVLLQGMRVIEEPLAYLDHCLIRSATLLDRLRQDHRRIEGLLNQETALRQTMAPLKFMQTLFKIESAPLGQEAQLMFSALTIEIERLHSQVCELFDTKFRELQDVKRTLEQARVRMQTQMNELREFITREKGQIQKSLHQLEHELAANQKRDVGIRHLSRSISAEIQNIIVGLQFQDIISQKLQHTAEGADKIGERLHNNEDAVLLVAQSSLLGAEQIQAVRRDLIQAEAAVRDGVRNIMGLLSKADVDCLSLREFQQITASSDGMVQVLLDMMDAVRKQVDAMLASATSVFEQLKPIYGMASSLTSVVRDLSQRIHLIGLNAQVQAAQFNHGASLEVLSARTSEISRETNLISEAIAGELDQVAQGLTQSVKAFEELQCETQAQQVTMDERAATAKRDLHALRDEAINTLHRVSDVLERIRNLSNETLDTVNFVEIADSQLGEMEQQLRQLAQDAGQGAQPCTQRQAHLVQELHGDYTMASERQLHARVLHGKSDHSQETETATGSSGDATEIEFFDPPSTAPEASTPAAEPTNRLDPFMAAMDEAASAPSAGAAPVLPQAHARDSQLPAAPDKSEQPPEPKRDQPTNLGDNVELF